MHQAKVTSLHRGGFYDSLLGAMWAWGGKEGKPLAHCSLSFVRLGGLLHDGNWGMSVAIIMCIFLAHP